MLLRASLNVSPEAGRVADAFRLKESLKTIELFASHGARLVVLAHIGRARTDSLRFVWETLKKESTLSIRFAEDVGGPRSHALAGSLKDGEVLLVENVRRDPGEENNDPDFAARLASLGDVYVNDAFSDSHRAHASIVGIPRYIPAFAGPNFMKEYEGISPARAPKSPSLAVIGGAKFLTKEPLLRRLLDTYDRLVIGGALANDFLFAKGYEVGKSLAARSPHVAELLENSKLILPQDVIVFGPDGVATKKASDVGVNDSIVDVGPATLASLAPYIAKTRSILWNGPLGNFENGYADATLSLARLIADSRAHSVIGGGDTVTAIRGLGITGRFSFVSTAGGAMLEFITRGTLPGIEALRPRPSSP